MLSSLSLSPFLSTWSHRVINGLVPSTLAFVLREGLINSDARRLSSFSAFPASTSHAETPFRSENSLPSRSNHQTRYRSGFSPCYDTVFHRGKITRAKLSAYFRNRDGTEVQRGLRRRKIFISRRFVAVSVMEKGNVEPARDLVTIRRLLFLVFAGAGRPGELRYRNVRAESVVPEAGVHERGSRPGQRQGRKEMAPGGVIEAT